MNIKVLGSGCKKCRTTTQSIRAAADELNVKIELEKVEDFAEIASFELMAMPGVVIDGVVVHAGSVPKRKLIESWLRSPS